MKKFKKKRRFRSKNLNRNNNFLWLQGQESFVVTTATRIYCDLPPVYISNLPNHVNFICYFVSLFSLIFLLLSHIDIWHVSTQHVSSIIRSSCAFLSKLINDCWLICNQFFFMSITWDINFIYPNYINIALLVLLYFLFIANLCSFIQLMIFVRHYFMKKSRLENVKSRILPNWFFDSWLTKITMVILAFVEPYTELTQIYVTIDLKYSYYQIRIV